jgi:hypothetical protein
MIGCSDTKIAEGVPTTRSAIAPKARFTTEELLANADKLPKTVIVPIADMTGRLPWRVSSRFS